MQLQVKGKNLEVSDSIRAYAEQKLRKLERQLHELTRVELELAVERNPSIAANQIAEATIWTKGPVLRAREASGDMRASIDQLTEKLLRQVKHYRDRRSKRRGARGDGGPPPAAPSPAAEDLSELVSHDFFVFENADSSDLNVVYRRKSGGYGLIEPRP